MGSKKQGMIVLRGSMKSHWLQYISALNLDVNPADSHGVKILSQMIRTLHTLDSKFIQPGFKFDYKFVEDKGYYHPSFFQCNFVNGYQRNYNMTIMPYSHL